MGCAGRVFWRANVEEKAVALVGAGVFAVPISVFTQCAVLCGCAAMQLSIWCAGMSRCSSCVHDEQALYSVNLVNSIANSASLAKLIRNSIGDSS